MTDMNGSVPVLGTMETGDNKMNGAANGEVTEGNGSGPGILLLETDAEKRERIFSLRIIYFTMFLISLGFSIVLTGIWPYLDRVSRHDKVPLWS